MTNSIAVERGLCCDSCQEEVNVHGCWKCKEDFIDGDKMICINHSQTDCEHYHPQCKPSLKEV